MNPTSNIPQSGQNFNNDTLYLGIDVFLQNSFEYLNIYFHEYSINYGIIIQEFIKELFGTNPGRYGINTGAIGALLIQLPIPHKYTNDELEEILKVSKDYLIDDIGSVLPNLIVEQAHYFHPGDSHLLVYIPVRKDQCGEEIFAKAVPIQAVAYLTK